MPRDFFAWQGFSIPLNEDWRPSVLSGSNEKGYARLESIYPAAIQIRWQSVRSAPDVNQKARDYLRSLERAARKGKQPFSSSCDAGEFEWHTEHKGYGRIWHDEKTNRVFMLERSGAKNDSFKRHARELFAEFDTYGGDKVPWCVYGIDLSLPSEFRLDTCKFMAGMSAISFSKRGCKLTAERWALAESLLKKRTLEEWARSATGLETAEQQSETDVVLRGRAGSIGRKKACSLVRLQRVQNQIAVLRSVCASGNEPQWEWLDEHPLVQKTSNSANERAQI